MALIIVHLQMHPSLHLPICTIIQCIFKIFQIIVDYSKTVFFLFLNFFQIQTYKNQNGISSVKFCIQFYLIQWHFKGCNKHIKKCSSSERPCSLLNLEIDMKKTLKLKDLKDALTIFSIFFSIFLLVRLETSYIP